MARQSARQKAEPAPKPVVSEVKDNRDPDGFYTSPIRQRVALTSGDVFLFEANKPQFVREAIRPEMISHGIMPVTGNVPVKEVKADGTVEPVGQKRIDAIDEAIDAIVKENNIENFSAAGIPKVEALNKILGFEITDKVRDQHWKLNRQRASAR
jgi:hypothetical protein